jgi:hypothetical protein
MNHPDVLAPVRERVRDLYRAVSARVVDDGDRPAERKMLGQKVVEDVQAAWQ